MFLALGQQKAEVETEMIATPAMRLVQPPIPVEPQMLVPAALRLLIEGGAMSRRAGGLLGAEQIAFL